MLLVHGKRHFKQFSQLRRVWIQQRHVLSHGIQELVELLNDLLSVLHIVGLQLVLEHLQVVLIGLDLQVQATGLLPFEGGLQISALV